MANNDKHANDRDAKFSYGVRELRQAQKQAQDALTLEDELRKAADAGRGFDPYNTSGGFDRRKHWARVGKQR
jgi:hypothetical protein